MSNALFSRTPNSRRSSLVFPNRPLPEMVPPTFPYTPTCTLLGTSLNLLAYLLNELLICTFDLISAIVSLNFSTCLSLVSLFLVLCLLLLLCPLLCLDAFLSVSFHLYDRLLGSVEVHATVEDSPGKLSIFEQLPEQNLQTLIPLNQIPDLCAICLDSVSGQKHQYAHLLHCPHYFCLPCLRQWRLRSWKCPICRRLSKRFLVHRQLIVSQEARQVYFRKRGRFF